MGSRGQTLAVFGPNMRHIQHVSIGVLIPRSDLEYFGRGFLRDHRRKWPEPFAFFYQTVDALAHIRRSRIGQNAATPQRPRAKLHSVLKPSHDFALRQFLREITAESVKRIAFDQR